MSRERFFFNFFDVRLCRDIDDEKKNMRVIIGGTFREMERICVSEQVSILMRDIFFVRHDNGRIEIAAGGCGNFKFTSRSLFGSSFVAIDDLSTLLLIVFLRIKKIWIFFFD